MLAIPAFNLGDVLPPFVGGTPGDLAYQSPYLTDPLELVIRFGSSPARNALLRGLLNYRRALRAIGIVSGFQWIDGSFVENKEARLGQTPGDIDVVTLFERPAAVQADVDWLLFIAPHALTVFSPAFCKANFRCDAFPIDLGTSGANVARLSAFWFSLFSHQRDTLRWKGIVHVDLGDDLLDSPADQELQRRGF